MTWIQVKRQALEDRGYVCEVCEQDKRELQAHHVFFRRMRKHKELDCAENMQLVCAGCHDYANTRENRLVFWDLQCHRFGEGHMRDWYDNLPLISKERFW